MPILIANRKGALLMLERQTRPTTSKSKDDGQDLNDADAGDDDDDDSLDEQQQQQVAKLSIVPKRNIGGAGLNLGFLAQWNVWFQQLQAFQTEHGHCKVPNTVQYTNLYNWVANQRARRYRPTKKSRPPPPQEIDRLDSIGFIWRPSRHEKNDKNDQRWKEKFEGLIRYKTKYGDCMVTQTYKHVWLSNWVKRQRLVYKKGELSEERITLLENIGFVWAFHQDKRSGDTRGKRAKGITEEQWDANFECLNRYKMKHGDCHVKKNFQRDSLSNWVQTQRREYKKGNVNKERITRLENMDFVWSVKTGGRSEDDDQDSFNEERDAKNSVKARNLGGTDIKTGIHVAKWDINFRLLQIFQTEHGHCRVPQSAQYASLYNWAAAQRVMRRYHKVTKTREVPQEEIDRLDSIGFMWNPKHESVDELWERRFECLNRYKTKHGDCLVDRSYTKSSLANWVQTQRTRYKKGELKEEHITRLENIGFAWTLQIRLDRSLQMGLIVTPKGRQAPSGHPQISIRGDACSEENKVETGTSRKRKRKEADSRDGCDRKQEIVESKLPPSNSPASLDIGTRVAVYWADADEYYSGTVSRKFGRTAFVEYDDGESEWIDVKKHKFVKLGDAILKAGRPDVDLSKSWK